MAESGQDILCAFVSSAAILTANTISPFVDAAREGRDLAPTEENTLADSIAVGVPRNPKKALRAVSASGGAWIAVPDEAILDTMGLLGRTEGVELHDAGACAHV